jgi:hypothetical protein
MRDGGADAGKTAANLTGILLVRQLAARRQQTLIGPSVVFEHRGK